MLDNVAHVSTPSLRTVFGELWRGLMVGLWQGLTAFAAAAVLSANGASVFGFNLRRGVSGFLGAAANSVDSAGRHEKLRCDFKHVSHSIGRNLVIFIDDLDRCSPEKVVETLEAVNFLVTAGECAVVMGMDYKRVQHCVGLVRKDLAEAESTDATREGVEAEGRTAYAHQYLQKLVNVEMPIAAERERVKALGTKPEVSAEEQSTLVQRTLVRLRRWSARIWGLRVWAFLLALAVSVPFAERYVRDALEPAKPFVYVSTNQDDEGQSESEYEDPQPAPPPAGNEPDQTMEPAIDTTPAVVLWPVSVGLFMVLILGLFLVLHRLHVRDRLKLWGPIAASFRRLSGRPKEVQDSKAFEKALQIWSEAIVHDDPTPRKFKRFLNRLRYFAAMLHAENGERFDWRREANLVALAALHHLNVDSPPPAIPWQLDLFQREGASSGVQSLGAEDDEAEHTRIDRIHEAWRIHTDPNSWKAVEKPGFEESPWPPKDDDEFKQFRKLSESMHV